ncbi:MAG: alpha-galactosidase [Armatimonadetes bacterium]|nr:alpha-galactosidase [Armatimonadota bacterium]
MPLNRRQLLQTSALAMAGAVAGLRPGSLQGRPEGKKMPYRFLMDNDGSNFFYAMSADTAQAVREAVAECPECVTTYLLCCGAGTYYYPTKVGTVCPHAKPLLAALKRGEDPFGMFLDALKKAGKETFVTYRMNDVHNPDAEDEWNLPRIRKEHPDWIVDAEAIRNGKADWMSYCLDYSRPGVRDYILATLRELVANYRFDGLQLDWMRFPRHLSGSSEEVWQKRGILTEFTAQARNILRSSGREILLSARVPAGPEGCRFLGLDIAEWTKKGLVDFISAAAFLTSDFAAPLVEMRSLMKDRPVPIYAGIEFGHSPQTHCPESLRAAALGLYDNGADGINLFNFPCWIEYLASRPYHWLDGIATAKAASVRPLLFSVSHAMHRIPKVDLPGQLPVSLPGGQEKELILSLPKAALPARRALLLAQSGGDIRMAVNGHRAKEDPALRHAELFLEYAEKRPDKENCRVFRIDPEALRPGPNRLRLANAAPGDLTVERINLGIW